MPVDNRPHLLLLHGWAYDGTVFDPLRPLLENRFRIHTPDLAPVWKERREHLEALVAENGGEWYGCGWSMGFLVLSELRSPFLHRAGIAALPRLSGPGGIAPDTVAGMREELAVNPGRIRRKFGQWAAWPDRPASPPPGGDTAFLDATLRYLLETEAAPDTGIPFLLGEKDAVLPAEAASAFPGYRIEILPGAGHLLPALRPRETAEWLLRVFL